MEDHVAWQIAARAFCSMFVGFFVFSICLISLLLSSGSVDSDGVLLVALIIGVGFAVYFLPMVLLSMIALLAAEGVTRRPVLWSAAAALLASGYGYFIGIRLGASEGFALAAILSAFAAAAVFVAWMRIRPLSVSG